MFIEDLEHAGGEKLKASPTCDVINAVFRSTRDTSKVHKDAEQKKSDLHCAD
jgi:hypothetical protein